MRKESIILVVWYFCIILSSCCKDKCQDPSNPECSNYNPCYGKAEVSAAFEIYDKPQGARINEFIDWNYAIDVDTIYSNKATFTALEKDAQYEWQIGTEIYTTQSVSLSDFPNQTNVEVKLIVSKTPNKQCFPNDDGKDTVTRVFHNIYGTSTNPLPLNKFAYTYHRKYRGYYTDKPDEIFDIEMKKGQILIPSGTRIYYPDGSYWPNSSTPGVYLDTLFNLPTKDDHLTSKCGARAMLWTQGQFQWYDCYYNKNWKRDTSFGSYIYSNRKYHIHGQNLDKKKDSIKLRCVISSDDGKLSDRTFIGVVVH